MRGSGCIVAVLSLACVANDPSGDDGVASAPITLGGGDDGGSADGDDDGGGSGSATSTSGASAGSDDDDDGPGDGSTAGDDGDDTGEDPKFDVGGDTGDDTGGPPTWPVRMIPGLVSITFYERTGGTEPDAFTFTVDGPELTVRLNDPLGLGNFDIDGAETEYYDVYYSDIDGAFELDGRYLTISGRFEIALPAGGGLNLAEIGLNFEGGEIEFGNYVASFVALGDNAVLPDGNADASIDGDLQTHTTMGNSIGSMERLRVTLGFLSSSGPPPG